MTTLVWLRNDLRINDNVALLKAIALGDAVIPVFIWAPDEESPWAPGAATRWWLHQSLKSLDTALRKKGSRLILRHGKTLPVIQSLLKETGAKRIVWNRHYEPAIVERDTRTKKVLREQGVAVESFSGHLLCEPSLIRTQAGEPFKVFTPFWKSCLNTSPPEQPMNAPAHIPSPSRWPASDTLDQWQLEPTIPWTKGIESNWNPGEVGAQKALARFLDEAISEYPEERNRPDHWGTSRLSPYLHFGEISVRSVWQAVHERIAKSSKSGSFRGADVFLSEVGWREFAHHLLFHFPKTTDEPLRAEFSRFPWEKNAKGFKAWTKGETGYPIVDAGMRELWSTGWMHNRVRMIVASFLVKDLLIPWQEGAKWFWDTLVDADLASNTLGWQWTAGCGADAAPYFRVFNPVLQGEKFDPEGQYVRRWIPELAPLPNQWIHKPWEYPQKVSGYPAPIVDHSEARQRALVAFKHLKKKP